MGQDLRDLFDGADHHHQEKVLAVQLGDAASTLQMPPAYHHRDRLQPDRRLHSLQLAGGCVSRR